MLARKGMTLVLVLVMGAFISLSAMLLFSTANMETMIAGNIRRLNQAKISAASGLNHFRALGLTYGTLRRQAGDLQTLQIIPMTQLSPRTSYEVKVLFSPVLSEGQYVIKSTGYYTKGGKVLSSHPINALFQGRQ